MEWAFVDNMNWMDPYAPEVHEALAIFFRWARGRDIGVRMDFSPYDEMTVELIIFSLTMTGQTYDATRDLIGPGSQHKIADSVALAYRSMNVAENMSAYAMTTTTFTAEAWLLYDPERYMSPMCTLLRNEAEI